MLGAARGPKNGTYKVVKVVSAAKLGRDPEKVLWSTYLGHNRED